MVETVSNHFIYIIDTTLTFLGNVNLISEEIGFRASNVKCIIFFIPMKLVYILNVDTVASPFYF